MSRSPQNASSTHASHNNCFIRRVHNRRAPYRTVRRRRHQRPRRNNNMGGFSIRSYGTTHIHTGDTAFGMMEAARPQYLRARGYPSQISNVVPTPFADTGLRISEHSSPGNNPQPPPSFRYVPSTRVNEFAGVPIPAAGRGTSVAGYHQQTHIGGHTYVPGPNIGPAPIATSGFAGQTSQAPTVPEYDTQAAAPPPTLDQQLFPPSLATAANNAFAEDFLLPAVFDNFMDMLEPRF